MSDTVVGKDAGTVREGPILHDPRTAPGSRRVSSKKGKSLCALGDHSGCGRGEQTRGKSQAQSWEAIVGSR